MNRRMSRLGLTALALIAGGSVLVAQQATGALRGRVADGKGTPKVGVTVTVSNNATGFTRSARTDAGGLFSFLSLPVGAYTITYTLGTETYRAKRQASLGQETDASFLQWPSSAGATVEVIAVSSQAALIDTSSAQVGTTVSSEVLSSLPLVSRDINQAAILAPGVQIVAGANVDPTKKTSSYITTGDGMGRGTSFAVDGADNNSTDVGGYVLPVPIDAIQEFQVVTNQYKAEFGRSTAGFFNVVTKSGGNEFAGVLSSQYQNDSLRARRTDEGTKSKDALGIYSATLSGPIIKDTLFFMISADRQQGHGNAYDFQPYSIALDPTLAGIKSEVLKKNVYAKFDWNISNTLTTSWNYGYYQDSTPNQAFPRTTTFLGNVPSAALGTGANKTWAAGVRLTWNISQDLVYETHYTHFDYKNGIHPNGQGPGNGSPMALLDINAAAGFPGRRVPGELSIHAGWGGIDPNAFQNTGIQRTQWKNELTYIKANHTFKGGLEFQKTVYADQVLFFGETGIYSTRVGGTLGNAIGGPQVDYMSGWSPLMNADQNVQRVSFVANGLNKGIDFKQYGIYLQDDWNVNPNWSVYGGIRVDWDTQLDYLKDRFSGMYAQIKAYSPTQTAIDGKAPEGKKYIEPRIQLLYRPNGDDNLVFKFGAGHFVANVIDNVTGFSRSMSNRVNGLPAGARNLATYANLGLAAPTTDPAASFLAGSTIGYVNGHAIVLPANLTPYNYANNVNGLRDYFRNTVDSWLTAATADTDGKALLASDFQYPTTDMFNVGVSYRLNEKHAFDAAFVYTKSKHLTVQGGLDGSDPRITTFDSLGNQLGGDAVFYSNQTASSRQLQFKYAYSGANTTFIATMVIKDQKSSEGGAAGAFDSSGATGGLYGEGASLPFVTNGERRSGGTERFSGSFQFAHRFAFGTQVSALASWHSGKAYDVIVNYNAEYGPDDPGNPNPNAGVTDVAHPIQRVGYEEGAWAMDLSLKVAHTFKIGKKLTAEPYVVIQNVLNNYDYGANYFGVKTNNDGTANSAFGTRKAAYQANVPRTGAVGVKVTF